MKKFLLVTGVLAALAIGIVAVSGIAAQTPTPTAKEDLREAFIARVAEKLGVTTDELTQAMTDARTEMIDEAVAQGLLTQEQADELKERIQENGPLFFGRGDRHKGPCRAAGFVVKASAEVLDMDAKDVVQELQSGKSLAEIAQDKGMSADDFKAALTGQVKSQLDALVAEEKITQERADTMFQRFTDNVDTIISTQHEPNEVGPCRGRGHYRQGPPPGEMMPEMGPEDVPGTLF